MLDVVQGIDTASGLPAALPSPLLVRYAPPPFPRPGQYVEEASALVIDCQEMYDIATKKLDEVKGVRAKWEEKRQEYAKPIDALKKACQNDFMPVIRDCDAAEDILKGGLLGFERLQRIAREQEQAALDEAARKERERLARQAAKAEAAGHTEKAEVLAATAAVMVAPIATSTYVAAKGSSVRRTWKARVTDKTALIKAVIESPAFLNLIEIDTGALDRLAKAMEGRVPLAGVECYEQETLARRTA